MKENNPTKQRSLPQNRSIHKGCQQIADLLVENGISLNKVIQNLEIRPTMNSVKDIFRHIAKEKFGTDSTADLEKDQIDPVWDDLVKSISQVTGVFIPFPSQENSDEYLKSLDNYSLSEARQDENKSQKNQKEGSSRDAVSKVPRGGNSKPRKGRKETKALL